MLHLCQTA